MKIFTFKLNTFLLLNALALLIFSSWINETTRIYWDILDLQAAEFLNGFLAQNHSFFNQFWAVLSIRLADFLPLIFMLAFFYFDDILFQKKQRLPGLIGFVCLLILMLIVREGVDFYVEYFHLSRVSPTLELDFLVRLSEIYPNFNLKDSSSESFPGDHATVLLTWLGYCLFFRRNRWSWAAAFLVIFFSLPRLIAGAHWLSDVLVGGLAIALVALAFGLFTPVLNRINQIFNTIANYFFSHFIKTFIKPFIKQK